MQTMVDLVQDLERKRKLGTKDHEKITVLIETRGRFYRATANLKSWQTPAIFERFAKRFARQPIIKIILSK